MPAPKRAEQLDELGRLLRDARKVRDLTQRELGEKLTPKLGQSEISALEYGTRTDIRSGVLLSLSRALGLDPEKLAAAAMKRAGHGGSPLQVRTTGNDIPPDAECQADGDGIGAGSAVVAR